MNPDELENAKHLKPVNQTITITLSLKPGQIPYNLVEIRPDLTGYQALRHFFEDIGYTVEKVENEFDFE